MAQNKLPTLAELHHDIETARLNDDLNTLLNQPPADKWIKRHPIAKVKNDAGNEVASRYLPIDKIEFMLTRIFQHWRVEVLREGVMFNSIYCTIRLHYKNPVTGEWSYHDGVGAKSVQVDKGASAADLGSIKDAAVQMALPSAKSYAIKDAAEHLGSLFGRDLNRRDVIGFTGAYDKETSAPNYPTGAITANSHPEFAPDPPHYEEPVIEVHIAPKTDLNDFIL